MWECGDLNERHFVEVDMNGMTCHEPTGAPREHRSLLTTETTTAVYDLVITGYSIKTSILPIYFGNTNNINMNIRSPSSFHKHCDGVTNAQVVAKSSGYKYGTPPCNISSTTAYHLDSSALVLS